MGKIPTLLQHLRFPVIGAPLFIISNPKLVIAQCKAGIVGSLPALNARQTTILDEWLAEITENLANYNKQNPENQAAPFAINLIVHKTNDRLEQDLALCVKYKVPIVITSLGAQQLVFDKVHSYGGFVFHDVINNMYAKKAVEKGADGLVAVAAGAGGHAGQQSPFALIQEIREWFDGPLALSGSIAKGQSILATQAMGADFSYIGSPFIATNEANAHADYKQMIIASSASDIVYSNLFTGVHGNYLKGSIINAGLDPDHLRESDTSAMSFKDGATKAWKDIWGSGQGIGVLKEVKPAAQYIDDLYNEYLQAISDIQLKTEKYHQFI